MLKIPVGVAYHEIFTAVTTGAVFAVHINEADEDHDRQAAKIVFSKCCAAVIYLPPHSLLSKLTLFSLVTRKGAQDLKRQADMGLFVLGGEPIEVRYNRNGYEEQEQQNFSRVLYLEGPKYLMSLDRWIKYFDRYCVCVVEYSGILVCTLLTPHVCSMSVFGVQQLTSYLQWEDDEKMKMEFRFVRVDGQSQTCIQALKASPAYQTVIKASYGLDPCDPGFSQASVAARQPPLPFDPLTARWR
jgi:hypothetical protein